MHVLEAILDLSSKNAVLCAPVNDPQCITFQQACCEMSTTAHISSSPLRALTGLVMAKNPLTLELHIVFAIQQFADNVIDINANLFIALPYCVCAGRAQLWLLADSAL
jgi:hypothetical protein